MAIEIGGRHLKWDTTTAATFTGVRHINAIIMTAGLTGGTTTLQTDGTITWLSYVVPPSSSVVFNFTEPQRVDGLTLSALGTNVVVFVYFA